MQRTKRIDRPQQEGVGKEGKRPAVEGVHDAKEQREQQRVRADAGLEEREHPERPLRSLGPLPEERRAERHPPHERHQHGAHREGGDAEDLRQHPAPDDLVGQAAGAADDEQPREREGQPRKAVEERRRRLAARGAGHGFTGLIFASSCAKPGRARSGASSGSLSSTSRSSYPFAIASARAAFAPGGVAERRAAERANEEERRDLFRLRRLEPRLDLAPRLRRSSRRDERERRGDRSGRTLPAWWASPARKRLDGPGRVALLDPQLSREEAAHAGSRDTVSRSPSRDARAASKSPSWTAACAALSST